MTRMSEGSNCNGFARYASDATMRIVRVSPFSIDCLVGYHSIKGFPAAFNDTWFSTSGIDLPVHIARSVIKRRKEFYFGRLCAREALREMIPDFNGQIAVGAGGRPQFPEGFEGSITHDAERAAAICQPAEFGRLGLDMERVMTQKSAAELWPQIAASNELEIVPWSDATEALRLTLIFSAKEALFKAIYPDIRCIVDFLTSAVVDVEMTAGRMLLRLEADLGGPWRRGREIAARFVIDDDRVLTLVSTRDGDRH